MKFSPEQFAKAKAAKSAEELFAYAKEIGAPMNEDEAKVFFEQWHKEGELSNEELGNVSGGSFVSGCSTYSSDSPYRLITTAGNSCGMYCEAPDSLAAGGVKGTCWYCCLASMENGITYCDGRCYGNDPYNT